MRFLRVLFAIVLLPSSFSVQAIDEDHGAEVARYLRLGNAMALSQVEAHEIISAANWNAAKMLEVVLDDDYFDPDELVIEAGKPYVLTIRNVGVKGHDISGEQFFADIVVKKIRHEGLTVSAYHLESISLSAGAQAQVWFVAKNSGAFPFICTVDDHLHEGMEGALRVVAKPVVEAVSH